MYQISFRTMLCVILVSQLSIGMAASPAIGVALAQGSFRVDDARVTGNSTLFEGTTVETGATSSQLRLNDGSQMLLASGSKGTIFRGRMILEKGIGQMEYTQPFTIEANGFRVFAEGDSAAARVAVKNANLIQVAALRGNVRVATANGLMLAAVPAGTALEFDADKAGASAPTAITGCLSQREDHYLLTDETTKVSVEVQGDGLKNELGHRIAVTGVVVPSAKAAAGATQVVQVSTVKRISGRCSSEAAAAAAGGTGAATAAGMGGATKAIIAGVVVAAAGTGAAVGLTRSSDEDTISR